MMVWEGSMFGRHRLFFKFDFPPGPFQRGDLKYVILDLIREKPRHGYEIIRTLEERSHGFYAPSPGAYAFGVLDNATGGSYTHYFPAPGTKMAIQPSSAPAPAAEEPEGQ